MLRTAVLLSYILILYSTLAIVRPIAEYLRAANLLKAAVISLFAILTPLALGWRYRQISTARFLIRIALTCTLLFIAATIGALPEERIHFLTYGLLGWLICWSMAPERAEQSGRAWLLCCLLAWLAGSVDELIQCWLPMRVFDNRDILFNGGAAMMGIAIFATGTPVCSSSASDWKK